MNKRKRQSQMKEFFRNKKWDVGARLAGATLGYVVGDIPGATLGYNLMAGRKNEQLRSSSLSKRKEMNGQGQHNDLSKSRMVVVVGKSPAPRSNGKVQYILMRDGHLVNKENIKGHAVVTTLFSKRHMEAPAIAAPNKPKLDEWSVNPFQLNPDRELSGSTFYTGEVANATQQAHQRMYYAHGSLDLSMTNFSQVSTKVTIKVWQAKLDASNYPQALGLIDNNQKNTQQPALSFANGIEQKDTFGSGGVTGGYVPDNPPSNATNVAFGGYGDAAQLDEPYGVTFDGAPIVKKNWSLLAVRAAVLNGGDSHKCIISLVGGKTLNLNYAAQSDNRWLKGSIVLTIQTETAVVKKYGAVPGSTDPTLITQAPQFVRGTAQIGWQLVESHTVMPLPSVERISKTTFTYMASNDTGIFEYGRFIPTAATTTDPGAVEKIIDDEDQNVVVDIE